MFHDNNPQLDTRRLSGEVRRMVDGMEAPPGWPGETAWARSLEGRAVTLGATAQPQGLAATKDYASLLGLADTAFIDEAHALLLGRSPTDRERYTWAERLGSGWERERMLLALHREAGEDTPRAELPGLARGLAQARWKYLPKLGRVLRLGASLLRLDRHVRHQEALARLQDERYQALLDTLREQARALTQLQQEHRSLQVQYQALSGSLAQRQRPVPAASDQQETVSRQADVASARAEEQQAAAAPPGGERDFYRALEARFRGSPAAIAELLREHLPSVRSVEPLRQGLVLMDLGCGRGEWLSLLREEGIAARGVDLNEANVKACQAQGLVVHYQDAISALEDCADASLGMITAFHLIEHLDHDQQRRLLAQAQRTLAPGGMLLLETPNPQNLLVGSCNFYLDPTHARPIPPDYLAFLAEFAGFANAEVQPLHPVAEHLRLSDESETALRINHYLYGPQDYALLATKASSRAEAASTGTAGSEPSEHSQERHA